MGFLLPLLLAAIAQAHAALPTPFATPPPALPSLPVIARIRLDVNRDRVLVVHELVMARGDWGGGDMDLWVSFGPVLPRALDARLLSVPANATTPDPADEGEPLPLDKLPRRPARAHPLLGRSSMAGAVLHVREPAFRRATAASNVLGIRVRQVLPTPPADQDGTHEVVVRLGMEGGTPLTLRRIDFTSSEPGWVTVVSAALCGPEADPYGLGLASAPAGTQKTFMPIDPALATRHATDDLCIRYVTR